MKIKIGLNVLRTVAFLAFLWLLLEGMRVWYLAPERIKGFLSIGRFFVGPWLAVFTVGAGGTHAKRLSDGALQTAWANEVLRVEATSDGRDDVRGAARHSSYRS